MALLIRGILGTGVMLGLCLLIHWLVYAHSADFDNGLIVGALLILVPMFVAYKLNGNRL